MLAYSHLIPPVVAGDTAQYEVAGSDTRLAWALHSRSTGRRVVETGQSGSDPVDSWPDGRVRIAR